jgi:anti-sigma regulatory factor (Ser/Thr protein kinase)
MELRRADWVFAAEAQSVTQARTLIAVRLHDLPAESSEVVLLLTSEFVTNAVRHGTGPVGVHVAWGSGGVRVEVEDQSPGRPVVPAIDPDALNGRGLILVKSLFSGWGVLRGGTGKTVWFTLDA